MLNTALKMEQEDTNKPRATWAVRGLPDCLVLSFSSKEQVKEIKPLLDELFGDSRGKALFWGIQGFLQRTGAAVKLVAMSPEEEAATPLNTIERVAV